MKARLFILFICIIACSLILSVPVLAESFVAGSELVRFVDSEIGDDTNSGTSEFAPFKTIYQAYSSLSEKGGTIVISGEVAISASSIAPVNGAIVFTSVYKGIDYKATGASLILSEDIAFDSDTYFENITLTLLSSGIAISGRANNLGFGHGISSVDASGLETFRYPTIIGGWDHPESVDLTSGANDYTVYVFSGNWNSVYGANRRVYSADCISDFSGDVAVVIKGGTFDGYVSATGMNVHSGRVYFGISGGTFNSAVVPICRLGTMPEAEKKTDAEFSANLLVRIGGGTFNGRFRLAENQVSTTGVTYVPKGDATVVVTGGTFNSDFVGYGVIGSVLLKYKEGVLEEEKIKGFPAWKTGSQSFSETPTEYSRFTNPLVSKADPYVIEKDGIYYYCFSSSVTIDGTAYPAVKVAAHGGIGFGELTTQHRSVFNSSQTTLSNAKKEYWAPELHYFDEDTVGKENAGWYIYFAADNGDNTNHRMYVLRATDPENPLSDYEMVGQITDSTNKWAIDGTVLQLGGSLYFVWSGWEGNTNVAQNIYIAKMSDPWTVSSQRVLLSKPEYSWETQGNPDVNEGPQVLKAPDGTVHIVYSASGSWSQYYCYGVLTLTGTDPLNASHWYKATAAQFSSGNGIYGPGHGSFVQDDGGNWWMYYHANASLSVPSGSSWWAQRKVYAKTFEFTEKTLNGVTVSYPDFGTPAKHESTQFIYARTADYHADGEHQYSAYMLSDSGEEYLATRICHICRHTEAVEILWLVPIVGDFNGDRIVTVVDVIIMIRAVLNANNIDGADVNGDGEQSLLDVLCVLKQVVK